MFKEIINKVQNKYRTHIEEIEKYNSLVEQSNVVSTLYAVPSFNKKDFTVSYKDILEECPNINESKAVVVRGLIPFYEVYLTVVYAKEVKTNTEYFLVPTSKGLWIINQDKYTKYLYEGLNVSIVKNNVTSKVINLSNIIFEVLGEAEIINKFINIINDLNYRNGLINEKISMFCGIVPTKSYINDIFSGISIDQYKNVVFHTSDFNYKYNIGEIENYEFSENLKLATTKINKFKTIYNDRISSVIRSIDETGIVYKNIEADDSGILVSLKSFLNGGISA